MNVMMIHDTSPKLNGHTSTYQISLTYLERQKCYGLYKLPQLFDLGVKGQGQMNVLIVSDAPSYGHTHTYQISLTYLERKKKLWPGQASPIILPLYDIGVKGRMKAMMVRNTPSFSHTPTYQISLTYL